MGKRRFNWFKMTEPVTVWGVKYQTAGGWQWALMGFRTQVQLCIRGYGGCLATFAIGLPLEGLRLRYMPDDSCRVSFLCFSFRFWDRLAQLEGEDDQT